MHEQELNLQMIAQRLRAAAESEPLPAPELWPRIAATHLARRKQRVTRRRAWAGLAAAAGLACLALVPAWFAYNQPAIDWQARAQALEMQIDALPLPINMQDASSRNTETELAHLDESLQAAYDRGAQQDELAALWQERSKLLGALLTARRQQFSPTRI